MGSCLQFSKLLTFWTKCASSSLQCFLVIYLFKILWINIAFNRFETINSFVFTFTVGKMPNYLTRCISKEKLQKSHLKYLTYDFKPIEIFSYLFKCDFCAHIDCFFRKFVSAKNVWSFNCVPKRWNVVWNCKYAKRKRNKRNK